MINKSDLCRSRRHEGGYNLIEISLACFILGIGLVSILSVFPVAIGYADRGVNRAASAVAAENLLTHVRVMVNPDTGVEPTNGPVFPLSPFDFNAAIEDALWPGSATLRGSVGYGRNAYGYELKLEGMHCANLLACTIKLYRNTDGESGGTVYYGVYKTLVNRNH